MRRVLLRGFGLILGASLGCVPPGHTLYGVDDTQWVDSDSDGYPPGEDCDDQDPAIYPDADEVCDDGVDNDCDGLADEDDEDCQE